MSPQPLKGAKSSDTIPLIAPRPARPAVKRSSTEPAPLLSHPRVSSVNDNFERVVNGMTIHEHMEDLFVRGAQVRQAPVVRTLQRQTNQEHQLDLAQLNARVLELEAVVADLLTRLDAQTKQPLE